MIYGYNMVDINICLDYNLKFNYSVSEIKINIFKFKRELV